MQKNEDAKTGESMSISEASGSSSDLISEEMDYAVVSSLDRNPFLVRAWLNNQELQDQFQQLLTTTNDETAEKLNKLAKKLDQELNRLKMEYEQQAENEQK